MEPHGKERQLAMTAIQLHEFRISSCWFLTSCPLVDGTCAPNAWGNHSFIGVLEPPRFRGAPRQLAILVYSWRSTPQTSQSETTNHRLTTRRVLRAHPQNVSGNANRKSVVNVSPDAQEYGIRTCLPLASSTIAPDPVLEFPA